MHKNLSLMRSIAACSLAIMASSAALAKTKHGQHNLKAEKEVLAFLDALTDAGVRRDVSTLAILYADEYFHTNADGSLMTKAQVLDSYKAPPTVTIESHQHDEDRVGVHDGMAFVSTRVTIEGRSQDNPFVRQWRITYLLEKVRGEWRAVTSHATLILQPSG